jgi:hypothetical protein
MPSLVEARRWHEGTRDADPSGVLSKMRRPWCWWRHRRQTSAMCSCGRTRCLPSTVRHRPPCSRLPLLVAAVN